MNLTILVISFLTSWACADKTISKPKNNIEKTIGYFFLDFWLINLFYYKDFYRFTFNMYYFCQIVKLDF